MKVSRIFPIVLFLLFALLLSACSGKDTVPAVSTDTDAVTGSVLTEPAETDPAEEQSPKKLSCTVTDAGGQNGADFILDFEEGRDIRILQIADPQLEWLEGARNEIRRSQLQNAFFKTSPDDLEIRAWRYMDEAVEKAQPDLIVLTTLTHAFR